MTDELERNICLNIPARESWCAYLQNTDINNTDDSFSECEASHCKIWQLKVGLHPDFLFGIMFNMIVVMYINYDVRHRDRNCQDLSGRSWIKTPAWDRTISQRGQTDFTDVRFGPRVRMMGLVRRAICWMIFPFLAAPASQAHNNGSLCNDMKVLQEPRSTLWAKTNEFACIFISPCRQVSFGEYWLILISALPGFHTHSSLKVNLKIYSLNPARENIAFSYSLHAVENYVQMALSLKYSEGNKLLLHLKWNNLWP